MASRLATFLTLLGIAAVCALPVLAGSALAAGSAFTYRYLKRQPTTSTEDAQHPEPPLEPTGSERGMEIPEDVPVHRLRVVLINSRRGA